MTSRFFKFIFNVTLITIILVMGFEFSGVLAQGLNEGGTGLNIPQGDVKLSSDIDKRPLADLILAMVNYFIGFLGFVAVIMFVYAGVLWVVAAGNDEQISKSKKIMTYSALGIVIVIMSYSIVRFITGSAGGGQTCSVDADCPNNGICNEQNFCEIQSEGGNACNTNADCSGGLNCNNGVCKLPTSGACLTSRDCDMGQYCSADASCKEAGSQVCKVKSDCQAAEECDTFGFCHNQDGKTDAQCSDNTNCATFYVCNLDKNKCEIQGSNGAGINGGANQGLTLESLNKIDDSLDKILQDLEGIGDVLKNLNLSQELQDKLNSVLSGTTLDTKITDLKAFADDGSLDAITLSALGRLNSALGGLQLLRGELDDLKTLMPEGSKTLAAWTEASSALNDIAKDPTSSIKLKQFESKYKKIKEMILTFPVVQSKIKATPGQGNAPFSVVLDGLDSFDPTGGTITDYKWTYLDAAGNPQLLGNAPVITHEFTEPNTYNIRLQVSTSNKDKDGYKLAMDGVSSVLVKVNPPATQIGFRINNVEAEDVHSVTLEEAKTGISFDPSISKPGLGKTITKYEWFYGDTLSEPPLSEPVPVIHRYDKAGEYLVTLLVTDNQGVRDKRVVKLMVKPLTAVINVEPKEGDVNTEFKFSSADSRTDNGFVKNFQWQILSKDNQTIVDETEENFSHTFEMPGKYQISLTITDSNGGQDKVIRDFEVSPREPVASFTDRVALPNHPNTLTFDASESYDPDKGDQVTYSWDFDGDGQFEIVDSKDPVISYTYRRAGTFKVILQVQDAFGKRNQVEKEVKVESILSADIEADKKAVPVGEAVNFKVLNSTASAYVWEFGDGQTASIEEETVSHTYTKAGKYLVKLNIFDREDNTNTLTYYVLVGDGDTPISFPEVKLEGGQLGLTEDLCGKGFPGYTVHRSDNLSFLADKSVNRDGSGRLLSYDWKFWDGTKNDKRDFTYRFSQLTQENECFSLNLIVRDELSGKVSTVNTLYFKVENQLPTIRDFIIEEQPGKELITPTKVKLRIIGATDTDGQIGKYRWWYYREGFEAEKLGVHSTSTPETEMVITAQGEGGQKNKYFFVAEVVDSDNGIFETTDRYSQTNFLEVTNGPNLSPVTAFTLDKTTISAGDSVTFVSQSYDPQGDSLPASAFAWDFDGDGSFDDMTSGPSVSHQYNTPGQFEVRLRVSYRGLISTARQSIFVQPTNNYPQASFSYSVVGNTVTFDANRSAADKDLATPSLTYQWDFDIQSDSDGNGKNDDDVQSTEAKPVFSYGQARLYRASLRVKDGSGMEGVAVRDVDLNLTSADRAQRTRTTIHVKAPSQPITLLNVSVSPYQLNKGDTADILATVQNADNSAYAGSVYFELLEGTGEFSPTPIKAIDSTAQTVFTAIDSGSIRIRITATDTIYGDISEEIIINVQ